MYKRYKHTCNICNFFRHASLDDVPNDIFNYERTLEVLHLDSNNIKVREHVKKTCIMYVSVC